MTMAVSVQPVPLCKNVPALIAASGDRATYRFLEFFTAQILNQHTRKAYVKAVRR